MKNNSIIDRIAGKPYVAFLPFLIFSLIYIFTNSQNEMVGDENRYFMFAQNLLSGYYSPPAPYIDLGNGPGYPLTIAPLVALKLPLIYFRLLNGVFYYFSIIFSFKLFTEIISSGISLLLAVFWGLYPANYGNMPFAVSETFTIFLTPLLIFTILLAYKSYLKNKKIIYVVLAGLILGLLVLTKPIFGYVLLFMILGTFVVFLFHLKSVNYKIGLGILLIALLSNLPYLIYTYNLTGKYFYWSSFGGNNLYWMTSPYEDEYGDWSGYPPQPLISQYPGADSIIKLRHQKDFDEIFSNKEVRKANVKDGVIEYNLTNGVAQDDAFKRIAIRNIRSHPFKFMKNCVNNLSRMLFNAPFSYTNQKTLSLRLLIPNGLLISLSLLCLFFAMFNWRHVPFSIRFLFFFSIIYLGGSVLGSAEPRMFAPVVPILVIFVAYILPRSVYINREGLAHH